MNEFTLIEYDDKYAADFKRLNMEWLEKYNLLESHDLMILDNPRGTVLDSGGVIYLAKAGDEIIGSAGLLQENQGEYELVKMAVTEKWQGQGISKMLMNKCLETAKEWKAKKIGLYTNSQLTRAIKMYEQYGFKHVELVNSPLLTADVRMEMIL